MIEVSSLVKTYNERTALDGISFSVKKGEILGFLGPNGAGKSTTMKILSAFMEASAGKVVINGFDVAKDPKQVKASIGYLPENPPVYTGMEVESYLKFAARIHGVKKTDLKRVVDAAMEKCGISDVRNRLIGNLSKGYRQRVGLAQAIVHNPPVLILDEPTVGLDPRQIIEIRNLIQSLGGDHTIILSTHILPEVQATCSRVVVIDRGRVVAKDTLDGIAARMQANARLTVTTAKDPQNILSEIQDLEGVVSTSVGKSSSDEEFTILIECQKGTDLRARVAEKIVKSNVSLLGLSQEKLSLEDAFVRLLTVEENLDIKKGEAHHA